MVVDNEHTTDSRVSITNLYESPKATVCIRHCLLGNSCHGIMTSVDKAEVHSPATLRGLALMSPWVFLRRANCVFCGADWCCVRWFCFDLWGFQTHSCRRVISATNYTWQHGAHFTPVSINYYLNWSLVFLCTVATVYSYDHKTAGLRW